MVTAIIMNLAAIIVIAGGWTLAVRVFYKSLGDPYARPKTGRQLAATPLPGASRLPGTALETKRAA